MIPSISFLSLGARSIKLPVGFLASLQMILCLLLFVLSQKVTDGLVKEFVGRTLLVNGQNLEPFQQLTVDGCSESLSCSHDLSYNFYGILRK